MESTLLTVAEIMALLRCSRAQVMALVADGKLPGTFRIGSRKGYRIPRVAFDAYLQQAGSENGGKR